MSTLDWLTLIAYFALILDIVFQIRRVHKTKSSHDLSLAGLSVRFIAVLIFFAKFLELRDIPLLLGESLFAITFTVYFIMAIMYFKHKKPRGRLK